MLMIQSDKQKVFLKKINKRSQINKIEQTILIAAAIAETTIQSDNLCPTCVYSSADVLDWTSPTLIPNPKLLGQCPAGYNKISTFFLSQGGQICCCRPSKTNFMVQTAIFQRLL